MTTPPLDIHAQAFAELNGFITDMLHGSREVTQSFFLHMNAIIAAGNTGSDGLTAIYLASPVITELKKALTAAERLSAFSTYPLLAKDVDNDRKHHLSIEELKGGSTRIEDENEAVSHHASAAIRLMRDEAQRRIEPFYQKLERFRTLASQMGGEENVTISTDTKERLMLVTHVIHALNELLPTPLPFTHYNIAVGTFHRLQARPEEGAAHRRQNVAATAEA